MKKPSGIGLVAVVALAWVCVLLWSHFTLLGIMLQCVPEFLLLAVAAPLSLAVAVAWLVGALYEHGGGISSVARWSAKPALVVVCFAAIIPVNWVLWSARDDDAQRRVEELQSRLESLQVNGDLPDCIEDAPGLNRLARGYFGLDAISYWRTDGEYELCYSCLPLGPSRWYSSTRGEWYWSE